MSKNIKLTKYDDLTSSEKEHYAQKSEVAYLYTLYKSVEGQDNTRLQELEDKVKRLESIIAIFSDAIRGLI